MDFNNYPSQSSQLIDPTQQYASASHATQQHIHALTAQNDDADVIADGYGGSDPSSEDTEEDDTEEHRQKFHMQIQGSACNPSWTTGPAPNACAVSLGNEDDEVDDFVVGGEFEVGQIFSSKKDLKDAVKQYSIFRNQTFRVTESKSDKYVVECTKRETGGCPWRLRAVKHFLQYEEYKVVRYPGQHTCSSQLGSMVHVNMTSEYINQFIVEQVRVDPSLKVKVIIEWAMEKWGYQISYRKAWVAKQKAIAKVYGDWEESYHLLQRWLIEMQKTNPGSVVQWCTKPTGNPVVLIFGRVLWAFRPCIIGFSSCRPLITIDSTHLYGKYRGCLLVAMAVDANSQLFPLAFAVVESENNSSWGWFLSCLRHLVVKRDGICVISDRHMGIRNGMKNECPDWIHRYCIRHLGSNVGKKYWQNYKNQFKRLAMQRQQKKFLKEWNSLVGDTNCKGIDKYLTDEAGSVEGWSMYLDGGHRYGVVSSNHAEVYNAIMKDTRSLPIAALVQFTFTKTNSWFVKRFELAELSLRNGDDYPPNIRAIINKNLAKGGYHKHEMFDRAHGVYSISTKRGTRLSGKGGNVQLVHLQKSEYSCSKWQIYHLPCSHVLCVCRKQNFEITKFIDPCYKTENYNSSYAKPFRSIPDQAYWSQFLRPICVADDNMLRGKGRPKSTRYKNEMDIVQEPSSSRQRCSYCGHAGHNKRKCPSRVGSSS